MQVDYEEDPAEGDEENEDGEDATIRDETPLKEKRIEGDRFNATYSFRDEDHTLGNLLRNQIIKSNHV